MGHKERIELIKKIEDIRQSRVLCYLTSDRPNAGAEVQKDAMPLFYEHLRLMNSPKKIDVLVFTHGGDVLAGFGLARLLREFTSEVGTLIPEKCWSSGTLFALGSNQIIMTKGATLSPIDPSITGPLNPMIELAPGQRQMVPLSVESVAGFKALVTNDWGIKGEESLTIAVKLLAERVHPIALGDIYRARQQIELLATRLLRCHKTEKSEEDSIQRIVRTLTKDLGSHDYLISKSEARELLGSQVAPDELTLEDTIWDLYRDFSEEMELGKVYDPNMVLHANGNGVAGGVAPSAVNVLQKSAVIESSAGSHVAERELRLSPIQVPVMPGMPSIPPRIQQESVRIEWKYYTN